MERDQSNPKLVKNMNDKENSPLVKLIDILKEILFNMLWALKQFIVLDLTGVKYSDTIGINQILLTNKQKKTLGLNRNYKFIPLIL